ncbi:primase homolog protein-like isoform X2 [Pistacia vera]|uniref:primase homolog protein-like isoform X2 n=1 Tax=Pistacia vera TaxID=55513 RepID=UPI0012633E46|nr:primase homolog protein-like isoform X2 [Pistacia vera]XP_031263412.1 primase homolog protein-like isoform X2 [Pistacia vera]
MGRPDSNNNTKVFSSKQMTEKSLGLEPLGDKLIAYFAERMISEGTLQRNYVMQLSGDKAVIAFPFRQNGVLVGCKYRTYREKIFWQERGTEKWLFGLDDIKEAAEIIIVEGEMDKLAMEEAGFLNCVSVPCGAPQKASAKEFPPREKDTGYQYIWNCKEHLDRVSRIILATDGDVPGQALAEELARRLGKERCCRVQWPKKDEFCCFNDANEVLKFLGGDALKEVIENPELYQLQVPDRAMQCT